MTYALPSAPVYAPAVGRTELRVNEVVLRGIAPAPRVIGADNRCPALNRDWGPASKPRALRLRPAAFGVRGAQPVPICVETPRFAASAPAILR